MIAFNETINNFRTSTECQLIPEHREILLHLEYSKKQYVTIFKLLS